ncbi:MAG: ATP-binding protein [Planctomycetes bacterium]|nr:ATP-binding protein [Planctomycetota bacterium]
MTQARLAHEFTRSTSGATDGADPVADALAACQALLDGERTSPTSATTTPVRPLVEEEARRALVARRNHRRARLRLRVPDDFETGAERELLARVVRNLVVNALEASPDDGVVEISAHPVSAGQSVLEVRDEGRGLAEHERARLFGAGVASRSGRGLGTQSVVECARELGAALDVSGSPGAGTCVRLTWPEPGQSVAVLVAEVPALRRHVAESLARAGLHVLDEGASRAALAARTSNARRPVERWLVARGARLDGLRRVGGALLLRDEELVSVRAALGERPARAAFSRPSPTSG